MDTSRHQMARRYAVHDLDGQRGAIHAARDHTREFLSELDPPVPPIATVDVLMLVSELVTNAVRHAPGPCTLYLVHDTPHGHDSPELTVAVSDTSAAPPAPRVPDMLEGSGGLGWHMVERLTTFVHVHFAPPRGKTIETTVGTDSP